MSDLFTWIITILVFQGVAALVNRSNKAKKKADAQRHQGRESEDSPNKDPEQSSPEKANPLAAFFENLEVAAANSQPNQVDSIEDAGVIAPQMTSPSFNRKSPYEQNEESQYGAYSHSESEDSKEEVAWQLQEEERREDEEYALQKSIKRNKERMEELERERLRIIGNPRPLDRIPQRGLLEQGMLWKEILGKPKGLQ